MSSGIHIECSGCLATSMPLPLLYIVITPSLVMATSISVTGIMSDILVDCLVDCLVDSSEFCKWCKCCCFIRSEWSRAFTIASSNILRRPDTILMLDSTMQLVS